MFTERVQNVQHCNYTCSYQSLQFLYYNIPKKVIFRRSQGLLFHYSGLFVFVDTV